MLGKLAGAAIAIFMIPTALLAQGGIGGAAFSAGPAVRGAVVQGVPTPAELNASSRAHYRSQQRHSTAPKKSRRTKQASPSLDGRTLGRMRTCGFDYLQYDGLGTPYGPYCN